MAVSGVSRAAAVRRSAWTLPSIIISNESERKVGAGGREMHRSSHTRCEGGGTRVEERCEAHPLGGQDLEKCGVYAAGS